MNSLKEFRLVLLDWRSLGPYLFVGSTAIPLADLALKLGPPWPLAAPVLFFVVAAVTNVAAFHIMHEWTAQAMNRSIRFSIGALVGVLALYLAAWGMLTVQVPAHDGRIPVGWVVQATAQHAIEELANKGVPLSSPTDLLNLRIEGGAEPMDAPLDIWTHSTVHASRLALVTMWSALVVGFSWISIAFTLYHRRKRVAWQGVGHVRPRVKRAKPEITAMVLLVGTFNTFAPERLQDLDLSLEYDRRTRQELDLLDASFMRWRFASPLRWTLDGDTRSTPLEGIVINKRSVQGYDQWVGADDWWMPITFTLAHEKSHLVQSKRYGNEVGQYPRLVREAQADVMAGAYVFLRIMKLQVDVSPDNRIIIRSLAPERTSAAFVEARQREVFDLMRLGYKLGRTGQGGEHPEGWERGQAVMAGLLAGTGMLRLSLQQLDESGFRREFGFKVGEDFSDWSMRKAYEIVGLPDGARQDAPQFTLSNAQDSIGSVLRRCVEAAPAGFAALRGSYVRQDDDSRWYAASSRLPDFHFASIEVDREDARSATVRYSKQREFPEDIELGLYQGLRSRLERLLREGWKESAERVSGNAISQRWSAASAPVEISIVHHPNAAKGKISLRISIEHSPR